MQRHYLASRNPQYGFIGFIHPAMHSVENGNKPYCKFSYYHFQPGILIVFSSLLIAVILCPCESSTPNTQCTTESIDEMGNNFVNALVKVFILMMLCERLPKQLMNARTIFTYLRSPMLWNLLTSDLSRYPRLWTDYFTVFLLRGLITL